MDILELLTDPEFITGEILIARQIENVDDQGMGTRVTILDSAPAIVQPATAKELETLPEARRINETISVWTLKRLDNGTKLSMPDRSDSVFIVVAVEQWPGFVKALASRENLS